MSESYGRMTVVTGPQVSLCIDIWRAYMRENHVDTSAIINALNVAVAIEINGAATSGTVTAVGISEIAATVGGILTVLSCTVNGTESFSADGGPTYTLVPNSINIDVRTIR